MSSVGSAYSGPLPTASSGPMVAPKGRSRTVL